MGEIGIRDLKTRASEVVHEVKEHRKRYTITRRGRPVALLIPVENAESAAPTESHEAWQAFLRAGEEISRNWQAPQSAVELLSEMRR
ncbi:MAG TPA: type II toxin-antitoxin system Phd/YefM family antitoxin [Anaerolineae bacterium]|nr:type II toxin-antitoxin system Phd/YefM family antitoxin [Anaerolineae bacterium]HOQ97324.1 type II toxin-antitoxin system Phd/YefM family antitoxin [Anaerolineae bacterium]HOQ97345.1 type II toxin-antitoxin system Phd/YefM family antitoxin [Anaerolineae bacterium]HPL27309.1 type II toxin-antitoxin system Phd/YefM family antitoxin [Anaerolineae bacterium]